MRGGLRWLHRPFQVVCVLVAVLLTAAFSLSASLAGHTVGNAPIPDRPNLGSLGESNAIALISGNPNAAYLTAAAEWLSQHQQAARKLAGTRQRFDQFQSQRGADVASEAERGSLFHQFLDWQARKRPYAGSAIFDS